MKPKLVLWLVFFSASSLWFALDPEARAPFQLGVGPTASTELGAQTAFTAQVAVQLPGRQ
jgi:hypothetical protein